VSGFLDNLIRREVGESKSGKTQSNPEVYPVYIDGVEVGELVVPPVPGWVIAGAIIGAVGTILMLLERIRRARRAYGRNKAKSRSLH